jgi:hypothetical protein
MGMTVAVMMKKSSCEKQIANKNGKAFVPHIFAQS